MDDKEALASRLYERYLKAVGGVAFNGDPLPLWPEFSRDETKKKQRAAWMEVVDQILSEFPR